MELPPTLTLKDGTKLYFHKERNIIHDNNITIVETIFIDENGYQHIRRIPRNTLIRELKRQSQ